MSAIAPAYVEGRTMGHLHQDVAVPFTIGTDGFQIQRTTPRGARRFDDPRWVVTDRTIDPEGGGLAVVPA